MKRFLRNAVYGVLALLFMVAVFWSTLVATAIWGVAVYDLWDNTSAEPTVETEVLLATATTSTYTQLDTLKLPNTFATTTVANETEEILVIQEVGGNAYYLASPMTRFAVSLQNGTDEQICRKYTSIFNANPCIDNQRFLTALASEKINDTHIFSSNELKTTTAIFKTLRTVYFPADTSTITPIHSSYITGYVASANNRSVAYIFDLYDVGYELTFVNMTDDEIFSVLRGITLDTSNE